MAQDCLDVRRCCANRLFMAHWLRRREILEVETTMMTTIKLPRLLSMPSLLLFAMLATVLAAGACGSDGELSAAQSRSDTAPGQSVQLTGTIEIDGSSTVAPITEAVAEEFRKVQSGVQVNVGISGSGGGFKRFTVGETDVSDASRAIKDSEAAKATENGIEYFEFLVGVDGLSVMVNPKNDFVDCMTVEQLKMIWEPESSIDSWSDIDSSWPDRKINLYGPGTDSGTFDYFTEEVVGEAKALASRLHRI